MDIYFQVLALFYVTTITVVFFVKKKENTLENYIYRGIIVVTFIEICADIACRVANYYMLNSTLAVILTRLFMASSLTWPLVFSFYILALSSPQNDGGEMTKEKKKYFYKALLMLIMTIVAFDAVIFVLPMTVEVGYGYQLIEGPIVFFVYGGIAFTLLFNLILLIKNSKSVLRKKYLSIHIFNFLTMVGIIVQVINPQISVNVTIASLTTILIYFTIENPDLQLIEELNIATRQAERANHAKSDFLSSMSHEIRTPLNAIIGFSQALAKEDISGSAKEEVKDILNASQNLLEIVNGILDISKIEANKIEIVNVDYSTRELLNEVSTITNTRIGSKPIEFRIEVDEKIPPVLYGDSMRIKQILLNLLSNAVKYTNDGYVLFQVNFQTIGSKCKLIIKVEDSGIGMTEQDLANIYTKFQRFDMEKNVNIAGTGLGMAITKGLVDLLGGELLVKSTYGEGTTFTLFLDQEISTKRVEDVETKEEFCDVTPFDASGQKVLVVDDNKINLKVAEKLLAEYKLEIELVDNGRECINRVLAGNKYDIIFLDIMMPKMKGPEVLQNLKNIMGFNMPVVALTADIISGMEDKYIEQGFDDCMPKPIVAEELFYMLKKFLKENEPTQDQPQEPVQQSSSEVEPTPAPVAEPTPVVETPAIEQTPTEQPPQEAIELPAPIKEPAQEEIELPAPATTPNVDTKALNEVGINTNAGLELSKDSTLYNKAMEEFYNNLENKLDSLLEYKNNEDFENYSILTNSLKTEARQLGFNEFGDLVSEHEAAAKEKNIDYLTTNYPKLKMESIRLYDQIKKYLGK